MRRVVYDEINDIADQLHREGNPFIVTNYFNGLIEYPISEGTVFVHRGPKGTFRFVSIASFNNETTFKPI